MQSERLDEFSRTVAERLFARFPHWRSLAKSERAEDGTEYLLLEVPAPSAAAVFRGLTIDTSGGEVTVGLDLSHIHALAHVGDGERFGTDYALHIIEQLIREDVAVVSWWFEGHLVAFSTIENGLPKMDDELVGPYDRVRIRSWKGTLNADNNA